MSLLSNIGAILMVRCPGSVCNVRDLVHVRELVRVSDVRGPLVSAREKACPLSEGTPTTGCPGVRGGSPPTNKQAVLGSYLGLF